jgi:hypothetical protein
MCSVSGVGTYRDLGFGRNFILRASSNRLWYGGRTVLRWPSVEV